MNQPKDIQLRRLQEVAVKGNFTINCDTLEQKVRVMRFFDTFLYTRKNHDYVYFKDIKNIIPENGRDGADETCVDIDASVFLEIVDSQPKPKKKITHKFFIKYESLTELLKLREIFNIRAGKFDIHLIKKRGYNPFTEDFYKRCADSTIYKIKR